ncbi:MAG: hypothetical protein WC775_05420 [Patescibacteria group bacterium]|jgi:hypothetical protein
MKLGPFYFDTKEVFLVILIAFLGATFYFQWNIPYFDEQKLLLLTVLILLIKGLLPAIHNESFMVFVLLTVFMSLYLELFPLLLFFFIGLGFFKLLRII